MLLLVNVVISNDFMFERQIVVYNLILLLKKIYYFELIVCVYMCSATGGQRRQHTLEEADVSHLI